jgi:hypothetical protein
MIGVSSKPYETDAVHRPAVYDEPTKTQYVLPFPRSKLAPKRYQHGFRNKLHAIIDLRRGKKDIHKPTKSPARNSRPFDISPIVFAHE